MKRLYIKKCSDQSMWYADLVETIVEYIREDDTYYYSRAPSGFSNIVKKDDGVVIDVSH